MVIDKLASSNLCKSFEQEHWYRSSSSTLVVDNKCLFFVVKFFRIKNPNQEIEVKLIIWHSCAQSVKVFKENLNSKIKRL